MSVLARDRSVSKLEFYHTALKLRKSLYFLAMRDFGTKDKVRDVQTLTKGMEPQDADLLLGVLERYHIRRVNMYWPDWVIVRIRESIWQSSCRRESSRARNSATSTRAGAETRQGTMHTVSSCRWIIFTKNY